MDERSMGRRDFMVVLGGSGVAVAGLTGCGGSGSGESGGTYRGDLAVSHLDDVISAAPFHVAAGLGYYRESGLQVRLVSFAGGADTVRAIAGKSRFGMPATLAALTAYAKGQSGLRIISGAFNAAEVVFIVPAASPIRSPKDLAGKKVAVSQPGSITNYFANHIASANGLRPGSDVKIVNVGGAPEAWTSAKQGVTDAAWSTLPLSTNLVARGEARVVARTRDYVPVWADNTYWSTQRFIDDSPEVLRKWLAAQQKAMNLIHSDLDRAAAIYGKRIRLETSVARKALEPAVAGLTLKIDRAGIEENIKAGVELKQFDADKIDLDKIIVSDLLPPGGS
jgi:NitT/TauT family transport system substrate-binding protein